MPDAVSPIEIDPEIMSGTPVIRGTRVPVETLFAYLGDGFSIEEFVEFFPTVERKSAVAVLDHARERMLAPAA